jgi:hypothetical protein
MLARKRPYGLASSPAGSRQLDLAHWSKHSRRDRSDQPFDKAILPGRGRCGRLVPDTHGAQSARVLSFKPQLRLKWRSQDGKNETEQLDHSASLGDSITSSTRIWFSVHTGGVRTGRCVSHCHLRLLVWAQICSREAGPAQNSESCEQHRAVFERPRGPSDVPAHAQVSELPHRLF